MTWEGHIKLQIRVVMLLSQSLFNCNRGNSKHGKKIKITTINSIIFHAILYNCTELSQLNLSNCNKIGFYYSLFYRDMNILDFSNNSYWISQTITGIAIKWFIIENKKQRKSVYSLRNTIY